MPQSRYERLDESIQRVLAEFNGENGVHAKLSRMDERMEGHTQAIKKMVERMDTANGRTGKIEARLWWVIGIGSATAITVGAFLAKLLDKAMQ